MFLVINTKPKEGSPILTNHIFYKLPKDLKLKEVPIHADLKKAGSVFRLKLKSDYLVKNLYISHKSVSIHFSDNYFDLLPGREKEVEFEFKGEFSLDDLVYKMLVNE
jgi:beta-mannosidase